jgi:addiction module RelB/DinJ family antitoxin
MSTAATIQLRVNPELKHDVDNIAIRLGTSTNEIIKMFLSSVSRTKSIPLDLSLNGPTDLLSRSFDEGAEVKRRHSKRLKTAREMHHEIGI